MAVVISLSFWWIYLFVSVLAQGEAEQKNITAKYGEDVTLPCRAPSNSVKVVEWSRPDLEPEYVLLYRGKSFDPSLQHPSFKNRVDLRDRQMKDGDVSLILKNVTTADNSTRYECRIFQRGTNRRKRANLDGDPVSIIYLRVVAPPPAQTGGDTEDGGKEDGVRAYPGLIAGISVCMFAVLSLIVFSRTHKKEKSPLPAPPDKEAEQQQV